MCGVWCAGYRQARSNVVAQTATKGRNVEHRHFGPFHLPCTDRGGVRVVPSRHRALWCCELKQPSRNKITISSTNKGRVQGTTMYQVLFNEKFCSLS
jgi:hypothetical protein